MFQDTGSFVYSPIDITEKMLEGVGFKKDKDNVLLKDNCFYWLNNGIFHIAIGYTPIVNSPCKYVHQLQNLYYSLKGKELEIVC